MSAAHGGQILVSGETANRCDRVVDTQFMSLGQHQLRGLTDSNELLQVVGEGLDSDFPAPAV